MATTKQAKKPVAKKTSAKKVENTVESTVNTAKAEVTEQAENIRNAFNTNFENVQEFAQKMWFASLGAFGRSVEEVQGRYTKANEELQSRYSQINEEGQKLVQDLVERGEKVQDDAEDLLKEGRANIEEQIEVAKNRLSGLVSVVDIPARLQDMSDKLEALSKDLKKSA
ncbi:MAG: hypothetical protein AAF431_10395 [Pseudomonadota bacterium]